MNTQTRSRTSTYMPDLPTYLGITRYLLALLRWLAFNTFAVGCVRWSFVPPSQKFQHGGPLTHISCGGRDIGSIGISIGSQGLVMICGLLAPC